MDVHNQLGSFPPGFTWDEAAIGYNAWGILTVHRDEWLSRMPLSFRSFGDYKSPLAVYITAASEKVFGPSVYAVRFPVALAGVLLVVASYFLTKELLGRERDETTPLVVMALVAISPWALHFSMLAFESMIAASLAAWASVFFIKGVKKPSLMVISGILYSLSLYAYHSAKLVVPLTILLLLYIHKDSFKYLWKTFLLFFVTCFLVSSPLLYASVFGKASDRFFGSTILLDSDKHLKPLPELVSLVSSNFAQHLSAQYLFLGKEGTYRQSNMTDGILSPIEGALIVIALGSALLYKKERKLVGILLVLIGISILPATLGSDVPHANRALLGLPWFQVLAGVGAMSVATWLTKKNNQQVSNGVAVVIAVVVACGFNTHWKNDARIYASPRALFDLQYGMEEAVEYARKQEPTVERVYFTNKYKQAYIFLLFFKHMNPIDYRGGGLTNYVISDHPFTDAKGQKNVLIIASPDDIPQAVQAEKEIRFPDGSMALRVVRQ